MEAVLFWVLFAACGLAAFMVIFSHNPVRSAMWLIGCFFFLSALYVLLRAHLLAGLQVLVYAGAIMVLFTFVIMLLSLDEKELGDPKVTGWKFAGVLGVGALAMTAAFSVNLTTLPVAQGLAVGSLSDVALTLYRNYALPFEIVGVLLLVAIVGAVVIAKRRI